MLNYINNRENLRYNEEFPIQRQAKLRIRHRINTNKPKHTTDSKKRSNMDPPKTWDKSICTRRFVFTLQDKSFQPYLSISKTNYSRVDLNDKCVEADVHS